jgi:sortase B
MKKRRIKKKAILSALILALSLTGIIYSLSNIFSWKKDTDNNKNIKEEINENIKIDEETKEYIVDFDKLKEQNSDTIAYLTIENTSIEYVVVKTTNNDYYLRHNFKKEYNIAGWIFADYRNKFDGTDKNIIIYGHNMKDGSMFSNLKNALDKKWQNEQHTITLKTKEKETKYQIFSAYTIEPEEYYLQTEFNEINYLNFIEKIKERSTNNYNINVETTDKILTLSTCNDSGNKRIVVHAKEIDKEI